MAITRRRWLAFLATSAAMLLWLPTSVKARGTSEGAPYPYALIYGTLWSPGQRPVYGVRLKLRRAGENRYRWEAISDHRGEFAIRVPAAKADYILVPDLKHTKDKPLPETRIHVENDERIDIGVHLQEYQNRKQQGH
jgi:hypothetical protein